MSATERCDINFKMLNWIIIQEELNKKVILDGNPEVKLVAGIDISTNTDLNNPISFATVVIMNSDLDPNLNQGLNIVWTNTIKVKLEEEYISSFLSFRELDAMINVIKTIPNEYYPDIILVDGCGYMHPRNFGLACHLGVKLGIPCIGVSKKLLYLEESNRNLIFMGPVAKLYDNNEVVGYAYLSARNPIYISIGHMISLENSYNIIKKYCIYRIPEPIRQADIISRSYLRNLQ